MKIKALLGLIISLFFSPFLQGKTMQITIGQQTFEAELADTEAAQQFTKLLPLTLEMRDHLRNEKFAELPQNLTAYDYAVGTIQSGDILLWQGNTLVIFYENFDTPYRYTKMGKISDVTGLKAALGKGNSIVTFAN
ncbi:cyclophilin-like fold protein [Actinobacillus genomosp. 1]|nr:cyclophilin-like fold protein [Actinobacillus genomosp. 1]WGE33164.1 cyclophilin-like fold protein [Actinobacillus genomosp. 1]WGE90465.1 cyclophilin-like fold protein [Actinobacillus genomosp. 1]